MDSRLIVAARNTLCQPRWKDRFPGLKRVMHKADVQRYGDTGNIEVRGRLGGFFLCLESSSPLTTSFPCQQKPRILSSCCEQLVWRACNPEFMRVPRKTSMSLADAPRAFCFGSSVLPLKGLPQCQTYFVGRRFTPSARSFECK